MRFSEEPVDIIKFCSEREISINVEPELGRQLAGTYRVTIANNKDYFKSVKYEIDKSWIKQIGGMYHKKVFEESMMVAKSIQDVTTELSERLDQFSKEKGHEMQASLN